MHNPVESQHLFRLAARTLGGTLLLVRTGGPAQYTGEARASSVTQ